MADKKTQEKQDEPKQQEADNKKSIKSYLKWIILAVVVVVCAGAGFGLGRLFGGSDINETTKLSQQTEPTQTQLGQEDASQSDSTKTWYYEFEPVVANLNEPGVTRYIRVVLTLQISTALGSKSGTALLVEKDPLLRNWLTIYLSSQTVDDIRGDRNLRRIQSEILDAFNEKLFPNAKAQIKSVLFKEFAIQ
jgi:flagellar basal body-associated protein FliL